MKQTDAPNTHIRLDNPEIAFAHRSDGDLQKMEWMFSLMNNPTLNRLSVRALLMSISIKLPVKALVKATIFQHFCGGETLDECMKTIGKLSEFNIGTILDYSVEGEKTESGFDKVEKETISTILIASGKKEVPFAVFKTSGIADVRILEKAQSGAVLSTEEEKKHRSARTRFSRICHEASKHNVRLFVDAEESWIQDVIDQWVYEEMANHNQETAIVYNTYQLYRDDVLERLISAGNQAKSSGYVMGAKLVRGAYMEKEEAYAAKKSLRNPIHSSKAGTDKDFNLAWKYCLENLQHVHFCSGSHNETSNLELAKAMDSLSIQRNDERIWFAQLYGMSDNISYALAKGGFNVAKYVPYGPVFSVMPYLVRRASENTSVAGQTSRELALIRSERKRRKRG
jgi:proline dehydrogenase